MSRPTAKRLRREFAQGFFAIVFLAVPICVVGWLLGYGLDVFLNQLVIFGAGAVLFGLLAVLMTVVFGLIGWEGQEKDADDR